MGRDNRRLETPTGMKGIVRELLGSAPLPSDEVLIDQIKQVVGLYKEWSHSRGAQERLVRRIGRLSKIVINGIVARGVVDGEQPYLNAQIPIIVVAQLLTHWSDDLQKPPA